MYIIKNSGLIRNIRNKFLAEFGAFGMAGSEFICGKFGELCLNTYICGVKRVYCACFLALKLLMISRFSQNTGGASKTRRRVCYAPFRMSRLFFHIPKRSVV